MPLTVPAVHRLARPYGAGWSLTLYPSAAEAGGCFVSSRRRQPAYVLAGHARDPERARQEAARRARARLRRYCAANRLNRLGTLTYAGSGCHDPRQARADVGAFFRALRVATGGGAFPYAWVPEWHKSGHGLHLHFAVGRFIPRSQIAAAWGHGFVHIKLLGDLPVGSGRLGESRRAAGYLSKYVTKSFSDAGRPAGLHRFDVAQGFMPERMRLVGRSDNDVIVQANDVMGGAPTQQWFSADVEGWQGPPAIWAQWG